MSGRALLRVFRVSKILVLALMLLPLACGGPSRELPGDDVLGPKAMAPEGPPPGSGGGMIQRFDKDGDGVLTADEVPEPSRGRVMGADADGDGVVTPEELAEGHGRMREGGGRGPGGRGGPGGGHLMQRYDANNDGLLGPDEIPDAMRARLSQADANGDGMISQGELADAHGRMGGQRGGEGRGPGRHGGGGGRRSFESLDKNADGFLSPEEIPEPMRNQFMTADSDGDGKVSREEADSHQRPPGPPR